MPLMFRLRCHGPERLGELAMGLRLDPSTVSRHVRQLEGAGLVERTGDPADARVCRIGLSEAGTTMLAEAMRRRRDTVAEMLAGYDDLDREQLRIALVRLAAAVERDSDFALDATGPHDDGKDPGPDFWADSRRGFGTAPGPAPG